MPRALVVCADLLGTTTTGRGEPGGLVVDRDRGLRAGFVNADAGVIGGGMLPLASAVLDTLCDLLLREPAIFAVDAPLMCGLMSGEWSGLTTVVASSTRSPNMERERSGVDV
jgi:hypothetical protein